MAHQASVLVTSSVHSLHSVTTTACASTPQVKEENDALREELGRIRIDHHRSQVGVWALAPLPCTAPQALHGFASSVARDPAC